MELSARITEVAPDPSAPGHFLVKVDKGTRAGLAPGWTASIVHQQHTLAYGPGLLMFVGEAESTLRVEARDEQDAAALQRNYKAILRGKGIGQGMKPQIDTRMLGRWVLVNRQRIIELMPDGSGRAWKAMDESTAGLGPLALRGAEQFKIEPTDIPTEIILREAGKESHPIRLAWASDHILRGFLPDTKLPPPLGQLYLVRLTEEEARAFRWPSKAEEDERIRVEKQTHLQRALLNNLRMLAAAADQYYLENGVAHATYDELVGPSKYVKVVTPVDGEDYRRITFRQGQALEVTTASGQKVRYEN